LLASGVCGVSGTTPREQVRSYRGSDALPPFGSAAKPVGANLLARDICGVSGTTPREQVRSYRGSDALPPFGSAVKPVRANLLAMDICGVSGTEPREQAPSHRFCCPTMTLLERGLPAKGPVQPTHYGTQLRGQASLQQNAHQASLIMLTLIPVQGIAGNHPAQGD
jgi:hypothetical protein